MACLSSLSVPKEKGAFFLKKNRRLCSQRAAKSERDCNRAYSAFPQLSQSFFLKSGFVFAFLRGFFLYIKHE
jgi:hypothetical protein